MGKSYFFQGTEEKMLVFLVIDMWMNIARSRAHFNPSSMQKQTK